MTFKEFIRIIFQSLLHDSNFLQLFLLIHEKSIKSLGREEIALRQNTPFSAFDPPTRSVETLRLRILREGKIGGGN